MEDGPLLEPHRGPPYGGGPPIGPPYGGGPPGGPPYRGGPLEQHPYGGGPHNPPPQVNKQLSFLETLDFPDLSRLTNDPI
jgi:hypothetical protein